MAHQNQGKKIRQTFVLGTNFLLHLVSFLLFLGYFGVPSIEKYLEKQTIIVTSEEQTNGIRAPAVTFSAHMWQEHGLREKKSFTVDLF